MTQSSPAYVPPDRKLEAISRRMHPIVNMGGWVSTWYGAHWRFSIPMDASTTSNGLTLDCDWRTRCRCHGTASMVLTDGFIRARFRSMGFSTFGKTRLAGRLWGYKCRCIITVPPWWFLVGDTIESTITCASGKVRKVEVKRPTGGMDSEGNEKILGAYRVDEVSEWKNYLLRYRRSPHVVRMLQPETVYPKEECPACDWLFAGSLLSVCLFSESVGVVDLSA